MESRFVNVGHLFSSEVQYIVPLFQRRYVWNEVEWRHLWEDIAEKSAVNQSQNQQSRQQHFTGVIVMKQESRVIGHRPRYEIVDGQQRLITFQIILCVLRDVCALYGYNDLADAANKYLLNSILLVDDPSDRYKLIPTGSDRISFISLIDGTGSDRGGGVPEAYAYFHDQVMNYVDGDRDKILSLFNCILHDFSFVGMQIHEMDEPGRIFESINASGRQLSEFEHLRNDLFLRAGSMRNEIYQMYWRDFEEDLFWTSDTLDQFLRDFLISKIGPKLIELYNVFDAYRRFYRPSLKSSLGIEGEFEGLIESEFAELKRYAHVYKAMNNPGSEIGNRMQFYADHAVTGLSPFILFIVNELKLSDTPLDQIFDVLESYMARRLLCVEVNHAKSSVDGINNFFSDVVKGHIDFSLESFVKYLAEANKLNEWPTNQYVRSALRVVGVKKSSFISYILYRIELIKRANLPTDADVTLSQDQFNVERIMPIAWESTWPLPVDVHDLVQTKRERDQAIQSIGNLTLVTPELNMKMGNRPFSEKKVLLLNSSLILNKEIYLLDKWDVAQIHDREEDLFECFCKIWPSAEEFARIVT